MVDRKRKLGLQIVSFVSAMIVLLASFAVIQPLRSEAAGTDLYVGYSGRNNNFSTVQAAVDRAASLNPSSEANRVTIHIAPGTYRQQVIVQTPYITFVNDEPNKGDAVLTWYYGIGYKYYSANSKGYYDANLANAKSGKNVANYRWGATVQLWPKATNFKAKNIVFENSFNRYITQEELADGVELTGDTSVTKITQARNNWTDANSKAATERAAALSVDTGYAEFLNCKFLSSQDTLYTGGSPQYYKNCLIEGQTDYIFGGSNAVFDSCELRWKGYSSGSVGGYITAAREQGSPYTGYLFKDCKVTANSQLTVSAGYLGRPWGQTAKVLFVNTTLQNGNMITAAGWTSMSGVQPESVDGFKENGTKLSNGQRVDLSQRKGHTVSDNDAANINIQNYMNNWTPSFLNSEGNTSGSGDQTSTNVEGAIKTCGGWYETAYVEWDSSKLGNNVKVSYAPAGSSSYTAVDSALIRGTRADIPGLKGNTEYTVNIQG
jgi:pectin methylesterase-like acyl-CoA thioesterase